MNKSFSLKIVYTLFFLIAVMPVSAQIPEGGTILNRTSGTTFVKVGRVTLTEVSVSNQSFTKAIRATTGTGLNNYWDAQIQFPSVAGIEKDDVILVSFFARTTASKEESGEAAVSVVIEHNKTYSKEIAHKILIGSEWKQYYASTKSKSTWTAAETRYCLFTGYDSQTIEIADVKFLNFKNSVALEDLPTTEISYYGREQDAPWRTSAQERIEQIRKGKIDIIVHDENGNVVENADVTVEMTKHKFGWGSAIPASRFIENSTFRNKVYELFNEVVFENDLKWPMFISNSKTNISRSLDSLEAKGIAVRGHNIIWPSWKHMTSNIESYKNNPLALRNSIDKRIKEVTKFTNGRLNDWDVINEPYSEHDVMDILGNEVMADWFKRVRNNDRTVKLYLNDYSIISGGGNNIDKQNSYYNLVKFIEEKGGEVDGIGMQGHMGGDLTSITKVYSILERFAELGKDIKITEHDINITQRKVQADYTRDFMTICFSHESVKSFLFWGFWANSHWLPEGALFDSDWNIRPHGEMYKDLVFNKWWTNKTEIKTDSQGKVTFDGFLGEYKYTIKAGEKERSGTFTLEHSKKSGKENIVVLSFDTNLPDRVDITSEKPAVLCEGEEITLNTVSGEGLSYTWFKNDSVLTEKSASLTTIDEGIYSVEVSNGKTAITSGPFKVIVNSFPEVEVLTTGDLEFCPGGEVNLQAKVSNSVSYNWLKSFTRIEGSISSIDIDRTGSYFLEASTNGCTTKSDRIAIRVYSANDANCVTGIEENEFGFKVYPNPFAGYFILETGLYVDNEIKAELYNSLGALVKKIEIDQWSGKTKIQVENPGFYTLRISRGNRTETFKLVSK